MQPYSRNRTSKEAAEGVYVRSAQAAEPKRPSAFSASRKRMGKRSFTLCSLLCAAVLVIYIFVYVFISSSELSDVVREQRANKTDVAVYGAGAETKVNRGDAVVTPTAELAADTPKPHEDTTTTTGLPSPQKPVPHRNMFDTLDTRTARPFPEFSDVFQQYENGEYTPEEPQRVPGLTTKRRTYTPEELLHRYADTDYVYSFVNGTEANHHFRKVTVSNCWTRLINLENRTYADGGLIPPELQVAQNNNTPACAPALVQRELTSVSTGADLMAVIARTARPGVADRETDELRHSIRSVEQHVWWHKGRVIMVSPGHHPTWVDGAKNFLAGACGDAAVQSLRSHGTHLRLTTVHQDAVMPYGMRLTANSHSIEQHLWRVRNLTAVHVYMNDDYFVNRDVAITDLFNEYGGTIVRTEKGIIKSGTRGPAEGGSWGDGVRHTNLFNVMELDLRHDDYLPVDLEIQWNRERQAARVRDVSPIPPVSLDSVIDVALSFVPESWPKSAKPRRWRRFATHAPFVYCTNMLRYMQTRYAREFSYLAFIHRGRKGSDLYVPFVYNAFVMARPWVASQKFLPYLLELHRTQQQTPTATPRAVEISLDNFDSCGQATLQGGYLASECVFGKFVDNLTANEQLTKRIQATNPLYFNINGGFSTPAACDQLRRFLHDKFPTPVYLESKPPAETEDPGAADEGAEDDKRTTTTVSPGDAALSSTFERLMALPVVGLVSYEEGSCPLVRSLALAFAEHHRGRVHVLVQRQAAAGRADVSLREMRAAVKHRVISAMSAPLCVFTPRVATGAVERGEKLSDMVEHALEGAEDAAVELPSTCGAHGAGVRVRGFVIDARMSETAVLTAATVREALAMPGQTLALEDFRAVPVGPGERDVVLVLSREDAVAKAVHWITGASENDLLVTFPLPLLGYEDMSAPLRWSQP